MKPALILLLPLLAAGPQKQLRGEELRQVTAVRCWSLSEVTRVVIEVSGDFEFRAERAHGPERIFFDVLHSRPHIKGRRFYSTDVGDKLIKRVRVAETAAGTSRVVLDLQADADYSANQLSNPDRLVVELRPKAMPAVPAAHPPTITQAMPVPPELASQATTGSGALPRSIAPSAPASAGAPRPNLEQKSARSVERIDPGRAAKMNSNGALSLTRALGLKVRRVVLDAGHGGHDEGTSGPNGLLEKELVLDVALRLGKLIESRMGTEVVFTRSDDTFIPLERRISLAGEKRADLFLSIHANSSPYPRIAGVESYYLGFTNAANALALASRENASSGQAVSELRDMVRKIALQAKADESKEFASCIQGELFSFASHTHPGIENRGVKKAPFVVLTDPDQADGSLQYDGPAVLTEIGFLSNTREESLLKKGDYRQKLAEALYRGVFRYAQSLSHFKVAQAVDHVKN